MRTLYFCHRSRPPPDQIAFGIRSDCVRRPIGLRSVSDWIAFGARCHLQCQGGHRTLDYGRLRGYGGLRGYGRDAIPSYVSPKNDKKRLNADADTRSVEKKE